MRVFVAGATGAIGRPLVRQLIAAGHEVVGMTRSRPELVRELGAEPAVVDVYDAAAVREAAGGFDVVINELTEMPADPRDIDDTVNTRMRTEGHRNLLAAAGDAQLLVQSIAFPVHGEAARAVEELERTTLEAGGVVLRYGLFYGPGTWEPTSGPRVHVEEAARRTIEAIGAPSGVIVVVES
jgi:uncharacterized protein YbjT (DUF2867 family)